MTTTQSTRISSSRRPFGRVNVGRAGRVASVIGGAALGAWGIADPGPAGVAAAVGGGVLLFRGLTGHCPINAALRRDTAHGAERAAMEVSTTVTVDRPRKDVYEFWRDPTNLPRFMRHITKVEQVDARTFWTVSVPGDLGPIDWETETVVDDKQRRIVWRSVEGARIDSSIEVTFEDALGGEGTIVRITIAYAAPAGRAGRAVARALNVAFGQKVREDMRRFRQVLETGEVPTTSGQTSARMNGARDEGGFSFRA